MARLMKDSGIEWIGEIPEEWDVYRAKYLFQTGDGALKIGPFGSALSGITLAEGPYKIYNQAHLVSNDFTLCRHFVSEETYQDLQSYEVAPGDILFSMMGTIGKCRVMPTGQQRGIMDSHLLKARLNDLVIPRFFEYVYDKDLSPIGIGQLSFFSNGSIMAGLNSSIVKNVYFPLPTVAEQQRIADFLDHKCAEIDAVIEKTKATIEEYKKLKQSVITEAVTKGIRGNRPMKDSGIDWIGEIPEEWESVKAKYCVQVSHGSDPQTEGDIPVYGSGADSFKTCGEYKEGPVVLVGRKGATLHIPHYIEGRYWNVDTAFDVKTNEKYLLRMYYYAALCFDYKYYMSQTTLPGMTQSNYNNMALPCPSIDEQTEIVVYLDKKCADLDTLIAKKTTLLTELETYKKSLIYEYVTGKKEVF